MNGPLVLVGPLADPRLMAALGLAAEGPPVVLAGRLTGGRHAGVAAADWPSLRDGGGTIAGVRVQRTPGLARYLAVMRLSLHPHPQGPVVGVQAQACDQVSWPRGDWPGDLAAAIAGEVLAAPASLSAHDLSARLPMIGVWAESRLRAAAGPLTGGDLVPRRTASDVRCHDRRQPFAGFFAVELWELSHRTHAGGFTPQVTREGFVMGDAVVVLPWDPVRDRVLLIEQFRFAPALRRDPQPWMLEPIAGRVDAGEAIETAARREAREEAALDLGRLFAAVHHYPSPGAVTEYLYAYVGIADLPDGSAGVHGLDGEAEDIRGHLVARGDLSRLVAEGQVSNGPLAMLSLWLDLHHERLRRELAAS